MPESFHADPRFIPKSFKCIKTLLFQQRCWTILAAQMRQKGTNYEEKYYEETKC